MQFREIIRQHSVAQGSAAQSSAALNPSLKATPGRGARLLLAGALLASLTAQAQPGASVAPSNADDQGQLQPVIITGSRIPVPANMTSTSPIVVVNSQELQLQGTTDLIDLMNNLPQNYQSNVGDHSNTSNPLDEAGGMTTADLRSLGPQRTLVLIDGVRLGIGDASTANPNPSPDLDQIPAALVERIEVMTGGASAIYGSDAIAGVVNFIMKRDFQGIQVDAQYGFDQHHNHESGLDALYNADGFAQPPGSVTDGHNEAVSVVAGTNGADDNSNVTTYFMYRNATPVSMGSRDFSGCKFTAGPGTPFVCNGSNSSNIFGSNLGPDPNAYSVVGNQLINQATLANNGATPPLLFNSNPYQYLSRQDERYAAGVMANMQLSSAATLYANFSFMNDRSTSEFAPGGVFLDLNALNPSTGGSLVNCDNPLLSTQERSIVCAVGNLVPGTNFADEAIGRRNIEGGARTDYYEHMNYRVVFGSKGEISDAWTYDAYGSYYYTTDYQSSQGYFGLTQLANALDDVTDPITGQIVCAANAHLSNGTAQSGAPGCLPYNIWTQGGVTSAQSAYLEQYGAQNGHVSEQILSGNATGDLGQYGIKSPYANSGVGVNLGMEYRADTSVFTPDETLVAALLDGYGGAAVPVDGSFNVLEEFGELRAPLATDLLAIHDAELDAGFRHSDYNTGAGGVNTYKLGLQWAPLPDFRLRWSYDRAIRAPSIVELYAPQSVTNSSVVSNDPCAGATPTATPAQCANTGVTASQYGHIIQCPGGQCGALLGGNPDLQPEIADTASLGVTFTPAVLPDFAASIDYYKISIDGEINTVPINEVFSDCLHNDIALDCALIKRTGSGNLFGATIGGGGYISGTDVNVASTEVSGVDVQLNYRLNLNPGWGALAFNLNGAYQNSNDFTPMPGAHTYNCTGLFGTSCGSPNPRWRHALRANWQLTQAMLLSAQWRYIGSVSLDSNSSDPTLNGGGTIAHDSYDARLPGISYLDLTALWNFRKDMTLRAGINNILDKDPPIVSASITLTGSPNTYPTYDLLGRVCFVGIQVKL